MELAEVPEKGRMVIESVGDATSSTGQDLSRGRPTEIDSDHRAANVPTRSSC